jgi:peptidoglycan/LPS O-acetylase OafA/YrhL
VLEFAGGVILGTVYAKYKNVNPFIVVPLIPIAWLVIWQYDLRFTGENRFIALGLPAFLAVACALSFEDKIRWNKFLCSLGDASYSLYLTHAFTIPVCMKLIQIVDHRHSLRGDTVCLIVIALSVAVAFACRRYVERPMTRVARRWLDQRAIA